MSSVAISFTPQRFSKLQRSACGFVQTALLAAGIFVFHSNAAEAGSATAEFGVSVRVVRSCNVSSQSLLGQQSGTTNGPVNVRCDQNVTSSVSATEPVRAVVSSSWVEGSEESAGTKLVTLNF
jgi:hypothetical protein